MSWGYRHTVLALCTAAFAATMVARLVISPVVPDIVATLSVSNGAVGLALSGMWAAYALTQFPSGILGDRLGERRVILAALSGTAVTALALAATPSYPFFLVGTVFLGVAAGLHYSVATALLSRQFDRVGRAIGIHVAGGPLAGLIAPVVAAAVAARYGWRAALALGAVAALPTLAAFLFAVRPTPPQRPDQPMRERLTVGPILELLSRPEIGYTVGLSVLGAFTWQATASFLPAFLEQGRGLSRTTAGLLFSAYFVIHGASQPVLGQLSDRYSRDLIVAGAMGLGGVGYGTLVAGDGLATALPAVLCIGVAMSWGAPLQSRFIDVLSEGERAAGFGLVRTVYMTLGATGSVVVGSTADALGWQPAFAVLSVTMALGVLAIAANLLLDLGY